MRSTSTQTVGCGTMRRPAKAARTVNSCIALHNDGHVVCVPLQICFKKANPRQKHLTDGLQLFCCPHMFIYIAAFQRRHESPRTCFIHLVDRFDAGDPLGALKYWTLERFWASQCAAEDKARSISSLIASFCWPRRTLPDIFIYDNTCHLHRFCLYREPEFFRFVTFLIDKFHWGNHVACQCMYDMLTYHDGKFQGFNSQACEQVNRILSKLKVSVANMGLRTAMVMLRHFIAQHNKRCAAKVRVRAFVV